MKRPLTTALSHSRLGTKAVLSLSLTMVFGLLAGAIEILYLSQQETVSFLEHGALGMVMAGLVIVLVLLITLPGQYLDELSLAIFAATIIYIFAMLAGTLFYDNDTARSLHAMLWFHPAFIAVTLTQPTRTAQSACWFIIAAIASIIIYYAATNHVPILISTPLVNHLLILLSLGASASLLYSLSLYREEEGADRVRIEVLQQSEIALRAEVNATRQARAELEQANNVVAGFLDNMSHELRTPLNGIIGFSELIHGEMFGPLNNEKYKEYMGDILDSGQNMLGLVNNLLYFSQLSAGRIRPVLISLEMLDILNEAADTVRPNAATTGMEIEVRVEGSPFLTADSMALSRMLLSLLDNAIKFSMTGGKINLNGRQKPDGQYEISVCDTGVGIEEAELNTVFLPFRKGGQSETNAVPGSGMGLALTKILMDLHGGSVSIDSTPGMGTCVTLLFPAQAAPSSTV